MKKKRGIITCKIVAVTPCWIDATKENGEKVTFLFLRKIPEERLNYYRRMINKWLGVVCFKTDEPDIMKFVGTTRWGWKGHRNQVHKQIAHDNLMKTIDEDINLVNNKDNQRLSQGRSGLFNKSRTQNKLGSALSKNIDNSEMIAEQRELLSKKIEKHKKRLQERKALIEHRRNFAKIWADKAFEEAIGFIPELSVRETAEQFFKEGK